MGKWDSEGGMGQVGEIELRWRSPSLGTPGGEKWLEMEGTLCEVYKGAAI